MGATIFCLLTSNITAEGKIESECNLNKKKNWKKSTEKITARLEDPRGRELVGHVSCFSFIGCSYVLNGVICFGQRSYTYA